MSGLDRPVRVVRTLGEGGFGAVYLVEVAGEDGFVQRAALKVLHANMAAHRDLAGRQRDEARLLAQLNHDHIVKVLDLGEHEGRPAVLMEYVEGVDAQALLAAGPFPGRAALEVVAAAADALDAASNALSPSTGRPLRVVHRDIKPGNLLVTAQGGVKVLDFGVARADFDREGSTRSVLFGTPRFMAPEMWMEGTSGPPVDVYALGVTLLELVGGGTFARPPLHPHLYSEHMEEALAGLRPDVPEPWLEEVRSLIRLMLGYEADARPGAAEVHDRALELAERGPGLALRRWARQVVPPILSRRAAEAPAAPRPAWPSPSPAPTLAPPSGASATFELAEPSPAPPPSLPPAPPPSPPVASAPSLPPAESTLAFDPAPVTTGSVERSPRRPGAILAGGAVAGLALTVALVWALSGPDEAAPLPSPATLTAEASPEPPADAPTLEAQTPEAAVPASAPDPLVVEASAPANTTVSRRRAGAPEPASAPEVSVTTAAVEPTMAPATTDAALSCSSGAGRVAVTFGSSPLGAEVWAAGHLLGSTPLVGCGLPEGRLTVTLKAQGKSTSHEIRVSTRSARSYVWDIDDDRWEAGH